MERQPLISILEGAVVPPSQYSVTLDTVVEGTIYSPQAVITNVTPPQPLHDAFPPRTWITGVTWSTSREGGSWSVTIMREDVWGFRVSTQSSGNGVEEFTLPFDVITVSPSRFETVSGRLLEVPLQRIW